MKKRSEEMRDKTMWTAKTPRLESDAEGAVLTGLKTGVGIELRAGLMTGLMAVFLAIGCGAAFAADAISNEAILAGAIPADAIPADAAASDAAAAGVISDDAFNTLLQKYEYLLSQDNAVLPREQVVQLPPRYADNPGADDASEEELKAAAEFDRLLEQVDSMPPIRPVDKAAIKLAETYDSARNAPKPNIVDNGRINFNYGTMTPRIVCRPLRLTDIELEPGEEIKNVHISDSIRWSVSGSWSGAGENLVSHIILKPLLPEISANLIVHTDKRVYNFDLLSVASEQFMSYVGFIYPETLNPERDAADAESWKNLAEQYKLAERAKTLARNQENEQMSGMVNPEDIYTAYTIKVTKGNKKVPWKPISAYDARGKTYIVMSKNMKVTEAPALFVKEGSREKLVNYRVDGNIYIVDRLFDVGVLVIGQDRVAVLRQTPVGE
jgi:type IV secretion system protein VirB9